MRGVSAKANNVGDTYDADVFNAERTEMQATVTDTGQTLDPEAGPDTDLNMLGKAMAVYGSAADGFQDSGAADAYVLARPGILEPWPSYQDQVSAVFKVGNTNTGASTVNVSTLGVKSITTASGVALSGGELVAGAYVNIRYNLSADRFELAAQVVPVTPVAIFTHQTAASTDGGTATAGAFETRTINTVVVNGISGASLSSNQITLPAGTFDIDFSTVNYSVDSLSMRVRNITDALSSEGMTTEPFNASKHAIIATGSTQVSIAGSKVFEVQTYPEATKATDGYGRANVAGAGVNTFVTVKITQRA